MSNLSFQYPVIYLLLIVAVAAGVSLLLYFRNRRQKDIPAGVQIGLGIIRFLVLFIIGLLLLSPLIKRIETETRKPIVLVAIDNSASIPTAHTKEELDNLLLEIDQLSNEITDQYDIHQISFGEKLSDTTQLDFSEKSTNIGEVFEEAYNRFGAENLSAIVLVSDGIFNDGRDPVYELERLKIPVYSVIMGDTSIRKDLNLRKVFHNKIAYLGDRFKVQVDMSAYNLAGQSSRLSVFKMDGNSSRLLKELPVSIDKADFFKTVEIELDANQAGVNRYRFTLSAVAGEVTTLNNSRDIFIDVLDARQKILLLAYSPHPDVSAIRQVLESNQNFEVEVKLLKDFNGPLTNYDLLILHQLPAAGTNINNLLKQAEELNIPRFFILGLQTNLPLFNNLQTALSIRGSVARPNEVQPFIHPGFSLFTLSDVTRSKISQFVPLAAPFGEYSTGAGVDVMLQQKIGQVETEFPLLLFQTSTTGKIAILCGEGFFKWRFFDYLNHENTEIADEIIQKTITYLNVKEDRRRFRAFTAKNIFDENEPLAIGAELYNESYEQINDPDAHIRIIDADGREFPYVFNKRAKGYYLEPGLFPVGQYRYNAYTDYGGRRLDYNGQFSVQPIEREMYELTSNHGLLRRLSNAYGGHALYLSDLGSLRDLIRENKRIKPVIYETSQTKPGIDLKWIFALLIILLGIEWFFRKYFGNY